MKTIRVNSIFQNPNRLIRDIEDDPTIGSMMMGLTTYQLNTDFHFDDAFDSADETYLRSTFLPSFVDEDNDSDYIPKIHNLISSGLDGRDFREINYRTEILSSLFAKRTSVQGEIQKVEWYSDEALTDKIIEVDIAYQRDPFGLATERTTTRKWVMNNGQFHKDIKTTKKRYDINLEDQIVEGKRRRGNIVNSIQLPTMGLMVEVMTVAPYNLSQVQILLMGRDFLDRHEAEFNKFIDNSSSVTDPADPNFGKKNIVVAIEAAALTTDTWLKETPATLGGATIEQYLVSQFTI